MLKQSQTFIVGIKPDTTVGLETRGVQMCKSSLQYCPH